MGLDSPSRKIVFFYYIKAKKCPQAPHKVSIPPQSKYCLNDNSISQLAEAGGMAGMLLGVSALAAYDSAKELWRRLGRCLFSRSSAANVKV